MYGGGVRLGRVAWVRCWLVYTLPRAQYKAADDPLCPSIVVLFIYATIGLLYFTLVTDDPLENSFLSLAEKQLLAQQQGRLTSPQHSTASATRPPDIKANLRHTLHLNCSLRIINLVA